MKKQCGRAEQVRVNDIENKYTYRWLRIAQKSPVDLGKPLVLLHLRGTALASQTGRLLFVQEPEYDVLARTENYRQHG